MTAEPRCWGGGGVSHPLQLTTGLVIKSITTSPTLAGERMLFILQVSILSEQTNKLMRAKIQNTRALVEAINGTEIYSCKENGPMIRMPNAMITG